MFKLQHLPIALLLCSHALASDRLIVEKITCKKPATDYDAIQIGYLLFLYDLVIIKEGKAPKDTPVTVADITQAAADGNYEGIEALRLLNETYSQSDNLFVNIDGNKVFPKDTDYVGIEAGESVNPIIDYSFEGGCTMQFIKHGLSSSHVSLGSIVINTAPYDKKNPGKDFRVDNAILMSFIEGSIYYVDYRVERNKGLEVGEQWQVCGIDMCRRCAERWCAGSHDVLHGINMFRNKPHSNSNGCRFPSIHRDLIVIKDPDWYLQICSTKLSSPLTKPPKDSTAFTGTVTFARATNRQGLLGEKPDRTWFSG